jgi:hypothetical protein
MPQQSTTHADAESQIEAMIRMAEYLGEEARGVCPIAAALLQLAHAELVATRSIERGEVYALEIRKRTISS